MSSGDTRALIAQAVTRLGDEVPPLRRLKLVVRLDLPTHGDAAVWRVEVPGPKVARDPAGDARVDVTVARSQFNTLATKGTLRDWVDAYERGQVRISGEPAVMKLIGNVITRQLLRVR
jgi:hypothetical protein